VLKVAPFLHIDGDPYPAVIGGRVVWLLDGYTTISNYPYSEHESLGGLTKDSLATSNKTASQPNNQINYIRNSVKATVDAYNGTVRLYAWDEQDPVLKTWRKVFPGVVQDRARMPADVLAHVRYPQDMFEVQRGLMAKYHVSDPITFYNASDQWTVPDDPTSRTGGNQPPYYLLAGSNAGTGPAEYQLTSPMKVNSRPNLAAFISVNSEATSPNYGKFTVLKLPSNTAILGPEQIFSQFNSNDRISPDLTLLDSGNSTVIHGNLLSLPIGNTFLYVEPLYVGSGANSLPQLRRVIVSYGEKIGYGQTLASALRNLNQPVVGQEINSTSSPGIASPGATSSPNTTPPAASTAPPPTSSATPSPVPSEVTAILTQLDDAMKRLQRAYQSGDFKAIGEAQADVQRLSEAYLKARTAPPGSTSPRPTPSPSRS
jgi:uncharacterized membrane protein (UPF0182 family)